MVTVNIHEAKTKLSAILADVERTGKTVVVCRHGKPVADIAPHRQRERCALHPVLSKVGIKYDPVETLAADEWPESER